MPTLYTHYYFGYNVLNKLNKEHQNKIKKEQVYYDMFNQGFDNLYYYEWKWKYYKNFGVRAHKKNVDTFFYNLINYIKDNNLCENSELTNMVYGFINHYTIDTILHPYINYQVKNLNIPHAKIEYMIDTELFHKINNQDIKRKNFNIVIPKLKFSQELKEMLNDVFEKTYNIKNIGKIFNRSHNNALLLYKYFIFDPHGIKSFFYRFVDKIRKDDLRLSETTFYVKEFEKKLLNKNKKTWHHPNDINEQYNYSLKELYDYSLKIAIKTNKIAYKVLHNNLKIDELINIIKKINIKNISEFH